MNDIDNIKEALLILFNNIKGDKTKSVDHAIGYMRALDDIFTSIKLIEKLKELNKLT